MTTKKILLHGQATGPTSLIQLLMMLLLPTLLLSLLLLSSTADADAYIPKRDDTVLEELPASWHSAEADSEHKWRQALTANPTNINAATQLARHYINNARQHNDPRFYGYAEQVLSPWNDAPSVPPMVLLLRATIKQHFHQFEQALNDLDHVLQIEPNNAQAWLTRASISQVTGHPLDAAKNCTILLKLTEPLVAVACLSRALSTSGYTQEAYKQLHAAYNNARNPSIDTKVWALSILADIAYQLDNIDSASQHYRDALALSPGNTQVMLHFTDFLIEQQQYNTAHQILHKKTNHNGLLLRLVITEGALNHPDLLLHRDLLNTRLTEEIRWNSYVSLRDQSRFHLAIQGNPGKALIFAQRNWQQQKELADLKLLLTAAIAAKKPETAISAIQWAQQHQIKDEKLNRLIALIQKTP